MIRHIKEKIKSIKEKHIVSRVSMIKDYIFAIIKILFGMYVQSYFLVISGVYSICVGLSKHAFFDGKAINESLNGNITAQKANEYKHLAKMAFFILTGSVTYVIYMTRLFFTEPIFSYGEIPAIIIAAVSFTEITLAIINLKRAKGVLNSGLRCLNLTSALTAIVLTQVAILSFAHGADASFYNALSGTIFGGLCVVVSLVMFGYYFAFKKEQKQLSIKRTEATANQSEEYEL